MKENKLYMIQFANTTEVDLALAKIVRIHMVSFLFCLIVDLSGEACTNIALSGHCKYGARCIFSHDSEVIKKFLNEKENEKLSHERADEKDSILNIQNDKNENSDRRDEKKIVEKQEALEIEPEPAYIEPVISLPQVTILPSLTDHTKNK
mgnify:CR=1 FL=1